MNFFTKAKDSIFLVLKGAAVGIGNAITGEKCCPLLL